MLHRATLILTLAGCTAATVSKRPAERIAPRRSAAKAAPQKAGPTALPTAPGEGERPRVIDSSLQIDLDNGRGAGKVRVGVGFALHGSFVTDDVIRFRLLTPAGRPMGKAVRCPQRASSRSGLRVQCRAKVGESGAQLAARNATVRFRLELIREGKPTLLRKGRFRVFKCSFGLCLDKDYKTAEHWAEFEGRRLTFRFTLKRRAAMPAMHPNPKRQARAKPALPLETVSTRCHRGKEQVGKTSESFEILDDDGVWTTVRARAGLGVNQLMHKGAGPMRCKVRINGREKMQFDFKVAEGGTLEPHRRQSKGNAPILAPWFWVQAKRPQRLDRRAKVSRQIRRMVLLGK